MGVLSWDALRFSLLFRIDSCLDFDAQRDEMASIKTYLERADQLAQDVIDAWNRSAGRTDFTPEFRTLLHKTFLYITAKQIADKHRAFDLLSESDEAEEKEARLKFVLTYKIFGDRRAAKLN